ncbi:amidase family protein [Neoroseomonas oryzicola]|uniref:Amidase n=1 Tax=Neoroseomonas oryzicola TaxID=535904 RepID=A0A9X9WHR9_9PROT|nr:amidase family protein [Neoroseomonas oryzicola]MBR0659879.1 amidase [Neoroseomonas oryzicola]NKE15681.1 amidase [Neoroseomonas oryzicola]
MSDLATLPATEQARLIRTRQASPVEVTRAVIERIEAWQPKINAMVVLDAERAMDAARAAEAAAMGDVELGPLHGVPVSVKDITAVKGLPTRRGTRLSSPEPVGHDSPMVARLKAAGAIITGKTTATEYGWTAVSTSPLTGHTHNPWKHGRTAGGSSSGAAALAGAGCGALHIGTDGAGSIRLPAHFCGAVGHKPTFGLVPYAPVTNNGSLSHAGPITRNVPDAALMLEVMAGFHPSDHTTLPGGFRVADIGLPDLRGLRIAYSPDLGHARVDPEVAEAVRAAIPVFERLGARVEEVTPPWGPKGPGLERDIWGIAMLPFLETDPARRAEQDPGLAACLDDYAGMTLQQAIQAQARRIAYAAEIGEWFASGWDLLVTPAASVAAFEVGRQRPAHWPDHVWDWLVWAEFSYPFDLSHGAAASIPCGRTGEGLPIGLQIAGPRCADALVLRAAGAFLEERPFAPGFASL